MGVVGTDMQHHGHVVAAGTGASGQIRRVVELTALTGAGIRPREQDVYGTRLRIHLWRSRGLPFRGDQMDARFDRLHRVRNTVRAHDGTAGDHDAHRGGKHPQYEAVGATLGQPTMADTDSVGASWTTHFTTVVR